MCDGDGDCTSGLRVWEEEFLLGGFDGTDGADPPSSGNCWTLNHFAVTFSAVQIPSRLYVDR